ncbi:zinc finger protein, partial [Wuchereria bancrofti]
MRKKQARPAKRLAGGVFPEDVSARESQEGLSPVWHWHSPSSSSPPHNRATSTMEEPDYLPGNPFYTSAMQGAVVHGDAPPLKVPKYELDDFQRYCHVGECTQFSKSQFAHCEFLSELNSGISASCPLPITSDVSNYHKSFLSVFTGSRNSVDNPSASVSGVTGYNSSLDSESPLKRLERCVRANSEAGCSTFEIYRGSKLSMSTGYTLTHSRSNTNSMKLPFGYDSTKTSAADALGELSQMVHRIGATKLPMPATPNKCVPNSITSNIFTCLRCAQRFDTLDELVLHISTTKHFTCGTTKNHNAIAPWERDRATTNFGKQLASSNFIASLFYEQKCVE